MYLFLACQDIFVMQGLPNFLTPDLVTLDNTIGITQSASAGSGPIRNAEKMESL